MSRWHPSGDIVEGVTCPRCRSEVIYNGNYFCANHTTCGGMCEWAMSDKRTEHNRNIITVYLRQRGDIGPDEEYQW